MQLGRPTRLTVRLLFAVGVLAFGAAVAAGAHLARTPSSDFNGTVYPDAPLAPDFVLTDDAGESVRLADLRGGAVLLYFGFTRCPDVCPLTLANLQRALAAPGLGPDRVRVLLISVDPEFDTPERLAEFIRPFGPNVTGLTGSADVIAKILDDYGVYAEHIVDHEGTPTIAHTGLVFGIDGNGRLRVLIHADEPAETVRDDIEALLQLS